MGSGKTEAVLDQPRRKRTTSSGNEIQLGTIRLQKDTGRNQVHAHDVDLYFRFDDINKFLDLWEMFWTNAPSIGAPENRYQRVIFRGLTDDPGQKRIACDLVFEYEEGGWIAFLEAAGICQGYVMNDPLLVKANYFLKYDEK